MNYSNPGLFVSNKYVEKISQALVDGKPFYTIKCSDEIAIWVRTQPDEDKEWFQHIDSNWTMHFNLFDVSEEFYIMLKLRWGT
jgi:hypothetical protein